MACIREQLERIQLVSQGWMTSLEKHKYTTRILSDIEALSFDTTIVLSLMPSSSHHVEPDPECTMVDNIPHQVETLAKRFNELKGFVDNIQNTRRILKREASGDEFAMPMPKKSFTSLSSLEPVESQTGDIDSDVDSLRPE